MKNIFKKIISAILEFEARIIIKKYHPKIVAVTGSVGKTSTKDAIYTVLAGTTYVRKSEKSFNSEIGVPLTILGCQNGWNNPLIWLQNIFHGLELIFFKVKYPECLVLEIGADKPGDIRRITAWLKPDIAVITKISEVPVHVEFFPSVEALLAEKMNLAKALKKGGTLVYPIDDIRIQTFVKAHNLKHLTFGISADATVSASHDSIVYTDGMPAGISFKLNYQGNSLPVMEKGVLGSHHMYPLMAAAAVGIASGVLLTNIVENLGKHTPSKGRMNIIKGIRGSTIIDDTYNSSPDALHSALDTLASVETTGRKIAVLGDMMELGKFSMEEHRKAGEHAGKVASIVISVGQRAQAMPSLSKSFDTSSEAGEYLKSIIGERDVVLVKGSQSVRMERVVSAIMAEPEKTGELLVRQESEWLSKK